MADQRVQRKLAAILAADVVAYSRLMGLDEVGTLSRLIQCRTEIVEPNMGRHGGRMVKLMGDGALIEFASAVDAVACAIDIQNDMAQRNAALPENERLQFRIGVNVGDVIVDEDDIYGSGVNIAARVEGLARPGGICLSRTARDQVHDRLQNRIEDLGEQHMKNIVRPIQVFRVLLEGDEPSSPDELTGENRDGGGSSIAVLAFDNMSGDPNQEYFSDGICEDIITDLSKLSDLHVIARNSSFAYKNQAISIPEVAKELGVTHVLEGSIRQAGNRIRVNAQLIDGTSGGHVWAERFDRDMTDIFEVQDELTQHIVEALKIHLTAADEERLTHKQSVNIEAYNLFLRGREQTWRHSKSGNIEARQLLERALDIEPDYAAALARMAFTMVIDYVNDWTESPDASLATGLELAEKAVALDPDEPQGHFALSVASIWSRDLKRALAEGQRCLDLLPNSPEGCLALAHAQVFDSQPDAALQTIDTYIDLDPHYPEQVLQFLAEAYISLGRYQEAVAALEERLQRNPRSVTGHALLASTLGNLGRTDEARRMLDRLFQLDPHFSVERRRQVLPYRDPADFDRRYEGFIAAGLKT